MSDEPNNKLIPLPNSNVVPRGETEPINTHDGSTFSFSRDGANSVPRIVIEQPENKETQEKTLDKRLRERWFGPKLGSAGVWLIFVALLSFMGVFGDDKPVIRILADIFTSREEAYEIKRLMAQDDNFQNRRNLLEQEIFQLFDKQKFENWMAAGGYKLSPRTTLRDRLRFDDITRFSEMDNYFGVIESDLDVLALFLSSEIGSKVLAGDRKTATRDALRILQSDWRGLQPYIQNSQARIDRAKSADLFWLLVLIGSFFGILYILVLVREYSDKIWMNRIETEEGLKIVVDGLKSSHPHSFGAEDLRKIIALKNGEGKLDDGIALSLLQPVLKRLLEAGVIEKKKNVIGEYFWSSTSG